MCIVRNPAGARALEALQRSFRQQAAKPPIDHAGRSSYGRIVTNAILIIGGIVAFGYGLRTFGNPLLRKVGALCFLAATYLAGWWLSGSHVAGAAAVGGWFLLPWVEIVLRVRGMRLPISRSLHQRAAPNREDFPHLRELTEELEAEGFEQTDDTGLDWQEMRQFLRVCYHAPSLTQAVIHLNQQAKYSVVFVTVTCRTRDGRVVTTSNYPFSQTMQSPPNLLLHRVPMAESFAELLAEHRSIMADLSIDDSDLTSPGQEGLADQLQADLDSLVQHNLGRGIIVASGDGHFRYSWRGYFYLWGQFLKDMVRFA